MALPIVPMTLPSDLRNVQNGKLPNELLVPSFIPGGSWKLHPLAARSMRAMVAGMESIGIQVRSVGTYRSYSQQTSLFLSRYESVTYARWLATPPSRRKTWPQAVSLGYPSNYWIKRQLPGGGYPATAAVPGTSNHGLGLAVDFAQELDGDPQPESVSQAMVAWLTQNAITYGWSAELQSEPWHWRYVSGDVIPAAVRTFEMGLQQPVLPKPDNPVDWDAIAAGIAAAKTYTLRRGSGGAGKPQGEIDAVKWCQIGLDQHKYNVGNPDGSFGLRTDTAVRQFQTDRKLLADGVVGPKTWSYLWP